MSHPWEAEWGERSANFGRLLRMIDIWDGGRRYLATPDKGWSDLHGVDYVMKGGKRDVPIAARVVDYWSGWGANPTFTVRYDYPLRPDVKTEWHRVAYGKDPAGFLLYAVLNSTQDGYMDAVLVNLESLRIVIRLAAVKYIVRENKGANDPKVKDSRYAVIEIDQFAGKRAVVPWRLSDELALI